MTNGRAAVGPPMWQKAVAQYMPMNTGVTELFVSVDTIAANYGDNGEGLLPVQYIATPEGGGQPVPLLIQAKGRYDGLIRVKILQPGESYGGAWSVICHHLKGGQPGQDSEPRRVEFKYPTAATQVAPPTEPPTPPGSTTPEGMERYDVPSPIGLPSVLPPIRFNPAPDMREKSRAPLAPLDPLVDELYESRSQFAPYGRNRPQGVRQVVKVLRAWVAKNGFVLVQQRGQYRIVDQDTAVDMKAD